MRFNTATTEVQEGVVRVSLHYDFIRAWLQRLVEKEAERLVEMLQERGYYCARVTRTSDNQVEISIYGLDSPEEAREEMVSILAEL